VSTILVAADAQWVRDQVRSAFVGPGQEVIEVTRGQDVRNVYADVDPDLVILDMQIGNMGGVAVALDLRLEESGGRLDRAHILLLLDREADEFIGRRADVDMMLVKPVDAGLLRRAAKDLLAIERPSSHLEEAIAAEGAVPPETAGDELPVADIS
jgi:DNA-binding response OmpR family regulator